MAGNARNAGRSAQPATDEHRPTDERRDYSRRRAEVHWDHAAYYTYREVVSAAQHLHACRPKVTRGAEGVGQRFRE